MTDSQKDALVAQILVPSPEAGGGSLEAWLPHTALQAMLGKTGWMRYFQQLQAAQLGVPGYWWLANPNLRQALCEDGAVLTSWLPGLQLDLSEVGQGTIQIDHPVVWLKAYAVGLLWHLTRQAVGSGVKLTGLALPEVTQEASGFLSIYAEEVAITAPEGPAILRFDPALLQLPFVTHNPKLLPLFANTLPFLRPGGETGLASQVYDLLEGVDDLNQASQAWVASELAMSERTLIRQLSEQGVSFRELFTAFRNSQAVARLCEGESIDRLAAYLGFSERAAFERAFKGWQGITPAKFQAQYRRLSKDVDVEILISPDQLPNMPAIASQLLAMIQRDDASLEAMSQLVEQDPVLTAKLISIASSAYYGMKKSASIKDVVVRVFGADKLRHLALAVIAAGSFQLRNCPSFSIQRFWLLSLGVAQLATSVYRKVGRSQEDQADIYLAGLLHNIGRLVLVQCFPAKMEALLAPLQTSVAPQELLAMEKLKLGVDACEAGALLLAKWQLPRSVSVVMRQLAVDKVAMMPEAQLLLSAEEFMLALLDLPAGTESENARSDIFDTYSAILAESQQCAASQLVPLLAEFAERLPDLQQTAAVIDGES